MLVWEVSLGSIFTIITVIFFGGGFYWKQLNDSRVFKENIVEIKSDLKILNRLVTDLALQSQRLDNQAERISRIERQYDELSHGKGFINGAN
jgi:hypothetical protein